MAALSLVIAVALVANGSAEVLPIARWQPLFAEASQRLGVSKSIITSVIRAESSGRIMLNGRPITSRAVAMGLMQLMPATWAELRTELRLWSNPYDPRENILAGTPYLRELGDRFGYPGMIAAYTAGRHGMGLSRPASAAASRDSCVSQCGHRTGNSDPDYSAHPGTRAPFLCFVATSAARVQVTN